MNNWCLEKKPRVQTENRQVYSVQSELARDPVGQNRTRNQPELLRFGVLTLRTRKGAFRTRPVPHKTVPNVRFGRNCRECPPPKSPIHAGNSRYQVLLGQIFLLYGHMGDIKPYNSLDKSHCPLYTYAMMIDRTPNGAKRPMRLIEGENGHGTANADTEGHCARVRDNRQNAPKVPAQGRKGDFRQREREGAGQFRQVRSSLCKSDSTPGSRQIARSRRMRSKRKKRSLRTK
jgi:hypothetical protein